ncbi:uncharacterized protein [Palaemon carinicauda]|uniref:uncharacterized protein n=1 Tax=Palaemon carinicauda TaxID=392227 RepID=UPI0035B5874D
MMREAGDDEWRSIELKAQDRDDRRNLTEALYVNRPVTNHITRPSSPNPQVSSSSRAFTIREWLRPSNERTLDAREKRPEQIVATGGGGGGEGGGGGGGGGGRGGGEGGGGGGGEEEEEKEGGGGGSRVN